MTLAFLSLLVTHSKTPKNLKSPFLYIVAYKDGSGFSLKTLLNPKDSSIQAITDHNLTYFFNPCENSISLPSYNDTTGNACDKGYMLCVYNKDYKNFTLLGNKDDAAFGERNGKMYMSFGKIPVDK